MDRRRFIKIAGAAGAGLCAHGLISEALATPTNPTGPALVVCKGPKAMPGALTRAAVAALGGMGKFVSRGDVVVVKPNIGWDRTPETAANTNPEVVAEVVRMAFEAGAKKVLVFDRTVNDPRRCYVQSGIEAAVKSAGGLIEHVDERKFPTVRIGGEALKEWELYKPLLEADKVINVPIAKHHSLGKLTMAMKNWMGVMGGRRNAIHQRLDQSLADLALAIKPTLTILDAVRILTANGPQGGSLSDVRRMDTIIASVDQVAVDAYGATLFGMRASELGYVVLASEMGLGIADLSKVDLREIKL